MLTKNKIKEIRIRVQEYGSQIPAPVREDMKFLLAALDRVHDEAQSTEDGNDFVRWVIDCLG